MSFMTESLFIVLTSVTENLFYLEFTETQGSGQKYDTDDFFRKNV